MHTISLLSKYESKLYATCFNLCNVVQCKRNTFCFGSCGNKLVYQNFHLFIEEMLVIVIAGVLEYY